MPAKRLRKDHAANRERQAKRGHPEGAHTKRAKPHTLKPLETAMRNDLTFPRTMRDAFGHEGPAIQRFVDAVSSDNGDRLVFWGVLGGTALLVILALVRGVLV